MFFSCLPEEKLGPKISLSTLSLPFAPLLLEAFDLVFTLSESFPFAAFIFKKLKDTEFSSLFLKRGSPSLVGILLPLWKGLEIM